MKFFLSPQLDGCLELQYIRRALLPAAFIAAAWLSQTAHAQSAPLNTADTPQASASQPAATASTSVSPHVAPASAAAQPRYAAADLKRAFNFMDDNHDGKISREEASRFRGVAKNFDRADTNHDGFLSREEFGKAMNYVKPKQP